MSAFVITAQPICLLEPQTSFLLGVPLCSLSRKSQAYRLARVEAIPTPTSSSSSSSRSPLQSNLSLTLPNSVSVDPDTGNEVDKSSPGAVLVDEGIIDLPKGEVSFLGIGAERTAEAKVYGLEGALNESLVGKSAILFVHGFQQRPQNYASLLRRMAVLGYIVIAPRTSWWNVMPPGKVETLGRLACLDKRIQTALIIDMARSAELMKSEGVNQIHLMGHSIGGAMALAYSGKVPEGFLGSIALLAPAVGVTRLTKLNTRVALNSGNGKPLMKKLAKEMPKVDMVVLRGSRDCFSVPEKVMTEMMEAMKDKKGLTGLGTIDKGTHEGFLDKITLIPIRVKDFFESLSYAIINPLFFGTSVDASRFIGCDAKQLQTTKDVLKVWTSAAGGDPPHVDIINEVEKLETDRTVQYEWNGLAPNV